MACPSPKLDGRLKSEQFRRFTQSKNVLMPVAILQIPLGQVILGLNLLFAAVAAIAGFVVLWFTAVRVPDIRLVPVELSLETHTSTLNILSIRLD